MFPSQSCHVYKSSCHQRIDPPLTWSVLCVEHLGRTKPRSACAGLWRPSFCVHYLLFMYIPLLWFVARETLCRKCSRSHVHREGKHISTAVAKTVHARTHTPATHTRIHTHKPPTKMHTSHSALPTSFSHDYMSQIQGHRISPALSVSYFQFFFFFSYFLISLMSDQGHLILSNPLRIRTESDIVYWLLQSCQVEKILPQWVPVAIEKK